MRESLRRAARIHRPGLRTSRQALDLFLFATLFRVGRLPTVTVEILTTKGRHVSYSGFRLWQTCGRAYELEKIEKVRSLPSWAMVGGSAHHTQTEEYDRKGISYGDDHPHLYDNDFAAYLSDEILTRVERSGFGPEEWRAFGRATKEWPNKEDMSWWLAKGGSFAKGWLDWRHEGGWEIVTLPNGERAIETEMSVELGDVIVKMFIDRLMYSAERDQYAVVDLKAGARVPASTLQLGFYATGIERTFGFRPKLGFYFLSRKGQTTPATVLDRWNVDYLTKELTMFSKAVELGLFTHKAEEDGHCRTCGVASECEVWK